MIKWDLAHQCRNDSIYANQQVISRTKDKHHMMILIHPAKVFGKLLYQQNSKYDL